MDDFLRTAQRDWRNQPTNLDQLEVRLRKHRWTPHVMLALEILGGVSGFGVGVWFFWMATQTGALLYTLAAVTMLAAIPAFTVYSIFVRRASLRHEDETAEGIIRTGLVRAEASIRAVHIGYVGIVVIAAFVIILWLAQAVGAVHAPGFVTLYTLTATVICIPCAAYLRWRKRRVELERTACKQLMSELRETKE